MRRRLVAILAVVGLLVSAVPVSAGSNLIFWNPMYKSWGYKTVYSRNSTFNGYGNCQMAGLVRVQEVGDSGINRLKTKFELKGSNTTWTPSYQERGYYYSLTFPNDSRSYYWTFHNTDWFVEPAGSTYTMLARMVGERPSFWQADAVQWGYLGEVGCGEGELLGRPARKSGAPPPREAGARDPFPARSGGPGRHRCRSLPR